MELSDLTAYAAEQYHISVQHKWADFPGFSVLVNPESGKWAALLMRHWDPDRGEEVQLCDVKCGRRSLSADAAPWLSPPFRMKGANWVGIRMDLCDEPEAVFRLFDRAMAADTLTGWTVTLDSAPQAHPADYQDTPLPFAGRSAGAAPQPVRRDIVIERAVSKHIEIRRGTEAAVPPPADAQPAIPERIRQMRRLYEYGGNSFRQRCRNFCVQGKFMEDFEDDAWWDGELRLYFPTYHDLRTDQLRGYFTWRTALRRGEFRPVSTSLAYIYVYELLNGIGAERTEDRLEKLEAFERGYVLSGVGDRSMQKNLRRWMLELAVLSDLPPETARRYADLEMLARDAALAVLRRPKEHGESAVCEALFALSGGKAAASPVLQKTGAEGARLLAAAWRTAAAHFREDGKSLFTLCFGARRAYRWHPLENAVYDAPPLSGDAVYELNECRRYVRKAGVWSEQSYQVQHFDKKRLAGFLHEADRLLRLYFKTGAPLRARNEDSWAAPYIEAVIEADRRAKEAAARPRLTLDLSGLEQIRRDAAFTRESLLSEEDKLESAAAVAVPQEADAAEMRSVPPDAEQAEILLALLRGESVRALLAQRRLMPAVVADAINEALFDEIGDSAVECDGADLTLVEDYRDDVARILGGNAK